MIPTRCEHCGRYCGGCPMSRQRQATSPDVRERELAKLRLRIAEAKAYGCFADHEKIAAMESRRDDLEHRLRVSP